MPSLTAWNPILTTTPVTSTQTTTVTRSILNPVSATLVNTLTIPDDGAQVTFDVTYGANTDETNFIAGDTIYIGDDTENALFIVVSATAANITATHQANDARYYSQTGAVIGNAATVVGQRRLGTAPAGFSKAQITIDTSAGDTAQASSGNNINVFTAILQDMLRIGFENPINPARGPFGKQIGSGGGWEIEDAAGYESALIFLANASIPSTITLSVFTEA